MKTLNFAEDNKRTYDVLYESVLAYPVKGIEQILKAAAIVEKLKSVGEEKGEKTNGFTAYKLKSAPTILSLEDEEFKYVKSCFENAQIATSVEIELLAQTARLLQNVET